MTMRDKRRTDQRQPVNSEPFWVTSKEFGWEDAGKETVLFDFEQNVYVLLFCGVEVLEAFDADGAVDVGIGSIATPKIGEGGVVTVVDADEYVKAADVTVATPGFYAAATSDLVANLAAGTPPVFVGAATTTPVMYATVGGTPTTGKARVHALFTKIPTAGHVIGD